MVFQHADTVTPRYLGGRAKSRVSAGFHYVMLRFWFMAITADTQPLWVISAFKI